MPEFIQEEIITPCDTRNLASIRDMIKATASRSFEDSSIVAKVTLAVDEAVANVMEHAYEGLDLGDVQVRVITDAEKYVVTIADKGHHFDPGTIPNPDIDIHVKEGRRDGLGIFLMRQIMDEIKYTFVRNKHNELRLVKYLPICEEK